MNRILIIKTSSPGDIVHAFPVVEYLHRKFPAAVIDWVVEEAFVDLVQSHPLIHRAIKVNTKKWRKNSFSKETVSSILDFRRGLRRQCYDVALDLQGNIKSGIILSQVKCAHKIGFGKKSVPEWPNLFFTNYRVEVPVGKNIRQDYLHLAASYFSDVSQDINSKVLLKITENESQALNSLNIKNPSVMVCVGSAWKNKQLPVQTLKEFLRLLKNEMNCSFLFIWGTEQEKEMATDLYKVFREQSQVIDRMPLPMLQNLMGMCDLVIAMDSLPLHLAGTTQTPTFSVFGASSAKKYQPLGLFHGAFQGNCPYGKTFEKRCPILRTCSTGACIRELKAEEVFAAFKSWRNST